MSADLLSTGNHGTAALVHVAEFAAMMMVALDYLMLHHRAVLMRAAMAGFYRSNLDMHTGSLRLAIEGKQRYTSENGEFCDVFFHGLCIGFVTELHAPYTKQAHQGRAFV